MGEIIIIFAFFFLVSFPVIFFDVSVDFLCGGPLKLSCFGCPHGLMVLKVFHIFARRKLYGIQHVFVHPQDLFVHGVIVVVFLFI